jgi:hypothetical protein
VWKSSRPHVKISSVCIFRTDGDAYRKRFCLIRLLTGCWQWRQHLCLSLNRSPVVDQLANHSSARSAYSPCRAHGNVSWIGPFHLASRRCVPQFRLRSDTVLPLANSVVLHVHLILYQNDLSTKVCKDLIERICLMTYLLPIAMGDCVESTCSMFEKGNVQCWHLLCRLSIVAKYTNRKLVLWL